MLFKPRWDLPDPRLHLGTASWSNKDWKGLFYPENLKPGRFLEFYADRFDTVEVDSSFYRTPTVQTARKWLDDTPEGFRFALKIPREITHDKVLKDCRNEFQRFCEPLAVLQPRAGFLLFQFGYFNKKSQCPTLSSFLERLDGFVRDNPMPWPAVVEVRNPGWLVTELFDFLRERGLVLALTAQEWMPGINELWEAHGERLLTGPAAYVRFLGERKRIEKITATWDKLVIDRTGETSEWVSVIREILDRGPDVWAYYNNHFAGYAPGSIELFRKTWEKAG